MIQAPQLSTANIGFANSTPMAASRAAKPGGSRASTVASTTTEPARSPVMKTCELLILRLAARFETRPVMNPALSVPLFSWL